MQLFSSVTVTVYVPGVSPVMIAVVSPLLQLKEYGAVPPLGAELAVPSFAPRAVSPVAVALASKAAGSDILTLEVDVQFSPSVAVTV